MSRKFYSILTITAFAFALVFGFGTLNTVKAAPGGGGDAYNPPPGTNFFGLDNADNPVGAVHRDMDRNAAPKGSEFTTDSYGLNLKSQQ